MKKRHVYIRPAQEQDKQLFFDWATESSINEFDPQVPLYPSSSTWCAYDSEGPLAYQTLQQPLMLESLAPRPGADKFKIASALKELTQNAITQAHLKGVGEIYYLSSDPETDALASNQIFEELSFKVYRVRISDLCS